MFARLLWPGRINSQIALVVTLITAACSGGSTPTQPGSGSSPGVGPACRTYPTNTTLTTNPFDVTTNTILQTSFSTTSRQLTVTAAFPDGSPCFTTVSTYLSTADFVDEISAIPPLSRLTSQMTTSSGTCGSGTATLTYMYDSQRRLTQIIGPAGTTTFNAWDLVGRPTAGTTTGGLVTLTYDNVARTQTQAQVVLGQPTTTVTTYDANGSVVLINNLTSFMTTTFTILSTGTVCR